MNLTIGSAASNTWKRIKLQYWNLIAGLAVAGVSAVVISGGWQDSSLGAVETSAQIGSVLSVDSIPQPATTYYIVSSAEQAVGVNYTLSLTDTPFLAHVLLGDTAAARHILDSTSAAWADAVCKVLIVDLRTQP